MIPEKELSDETLEVTCPRAASAVGHYDRKAVLASRIVKQRGKVERSVYLSVASWVPPNGSP